MKHLPMRNVWLFYLAIMAPIISLYFLGRYDLIASQTFAISLLAYALIYHPLVSGLRLISLHVIDRKDLWKNWIPFWNNKYYGVLFWGRKLAKTQ